MAGCPTRCHRRHSGRPQTAAAHDTPSASSAGRRPSGTDATFCRRCGLPYGDAPRADAELPACPVCYVTVDDDGRLKSLDMPGLRVDLRHHRSEHDRHPVGDDEWLETLREGDRLRWGRWTAPFDTVRRYLVTGQVERAQPPAGPRRDRDGDDPAPPLGRRRRRSSATSPSGRRRAAPSAS